MSILNITGLLECPPKGGRLVGSKAIIRRFGGVFFLRPGLDGGRRKTYDVAVFRTGR
jgi:hypothetical protein